jgi:dUTP pyrophosphatase
MNEIAVKIINQSDNPLPTYTTQGSSGMDLRAFLDNSEVLDPMQIIAITTGLFIELPLGYEGQVRPRSGLALKQGLTVLNTPGTIDSDYRGEIKVILINLSGQQQEIKPGERIAQLIVQKVDRVQLKLVDKLQDSERGEGGFGHTGKH